MAGKNALSLSPYVWSYNGRCEEAIALYCKVLDAKVVVKMRYSDHPNAEAEFRARPEVNLHAIMHAQLEIGGTSLMMSDGGPGTAVKPQGFSLALMIDSESEAQRIFSALSEGGSVVQPMEKTFFSPKFGMCKDRYGVGGTVVTSN